jgi:NAD+ kinase
LFKTIGIVPRLDSDDALNLAIKIYQYLKSRKLDTFPEVEFAKKKGFGQGVSLSKMEVDLIITIGGDGTVLKTSMSIPKPETPILAINMGRRGYLTKVEPHQALIALKECLQGKYDLEKHSKLSVYFRGKNIAEGVNEALLTPAKPWKMLNFVLEQNNNKLIEQRADGLIIATPTGSTAHSFSAGGPILETSLHAFVVVFISPADYVRSLVLSSNNDISIKLADTNMGALLTVDGRYIQQLTPEESIIIRESKNRTVFVKLNSSFWRRRLTRHKSETEIG